jgi:hypothetical protein
MPKISRDNQATCVEFSHLTCWFSYETVIAFQIGGHHRVVSKNYWSQTTGRHLNAIDGGGKAVKARVDADTFAKLWASTVFDNSESEVA